jgi:hypothetical protein
MKQRHRWPLVIQRFHKPLGIPSLPTYIHTRLEMLSRPLAECETAKFPHPFCQLALSMLNIVRSGTPALSISIFALPAFLCLVFLCRRKLSTNHCSLFFLLSDSASRFSSDAFPFLTLLLFLSDDILSVFDLSPGSSTNSYIPPSPARLRSLSFFPTFLLSGHCRYTYPFSSPETALCLLHSTYHTFSPSRDDPA